MEKISHAARSEWIRGARQQDEQQGESGDLVRQLYYDPAIRPLIGDVASKDVLDAGCGNGYWTRKLAQEARYVVGADFSSELTARASAYDRPANLDYVTMDIGSAWGFKDSSFDLVVSNVVLDYVPDIDAFATETHRVLRNNGSLVFGVVHPFFNTHQMNIGSPMFDKQLGYFQSGTVHKKAYRGSLDVTLQHRTVSDYINPFLTTGMSLMEIDEPPHPKKLLEEEPKYTQEVAFPRFLLLKFGKGE